MEPAAEEIGANRWFVLLRDDVGYALWSAAEEDDGPIVTFPDSEAGFDDAWGAFERRTRRARRGRALGWLAAGVAASGGLWALGSVVEAVLYAIAATHLTRSISSIYTWALGASSAARIVFEVALATYVVVWMEFRRRD